MTAEELLTAEDEERFFKIPLDARGMRYEPYFVEGTLNEISISGYTSSNARQMNVEEVTELLLSNLEFQQILGWKIEDINFGRNATRNHKTFGDNKITWCEL